MHLINGCGHWLQIEHAEEFADRVLHFLAPIGLSEDLPVGLQLMAATGDNAALYRGGAALEAG